MRLLSWNVNGIRSALRSGLSPIIESAEYEAIMLQESKADVIPLDIRTNNYIPYVFTAKKKGYSGTVTLTKTEPLSHIHGIGESKFDREGRVLTLEFKNFYLVNAYFPNSRRDLSRLSFKLEFDKKIEDFIEGLRAKKPIIICGDFNVAHQEIDIARPKSNTKNAGFTAEERAWFTDFLKKGYLDSYRLFVKEGGHYTWWSYRFDAKKRNIGWRIDYFVVSKELLNDVKGVGILTDVVGSDHVPVYIDIK
jgi:exodeoxyribonuclease-3